MLCRSEAQTDRQTSYTSLLHRWCDRGHVLTLRLISCTFTVGICLIFNYRCNLCLPGEGLLALQQRTCVAGELSLGRRPSPLLFPGGPAQRYPNMGKDTPLKNMSFLVPTTRVCNSCCFSASLNCLENMTCFRGQAML